MQKKSFLLGALLAAAAATGCEKSNDVGRLQDEANGVVARAIPRFDELAKREDQLRGRVPSGKAQALFDDARARTSQIRSMLDPRKAKDAIQVAANTGNPEELEKLIDTLHERLDDTETEIVANLTVVENVIAGMEQAPPQVAAQQPPAAE